MTTRIWNPEEPVNFADLQVGDKVRAVYTRSTAAKGDQVVGIIDALYSGTNDARIIDESGRDHTVWAGMRTFYLIQPIGPNLRREPALIQQQDSSDSFEFEVAGRTFRVPTGGHVRAWIEDGRTHVELVFP